MYQYLVGVSIMGAIWFIIFLLRKDLRKAMLWSGAFYIIILTVGFFAHSLVADNPARAITPGYWTPHTLLNIGAITGGYAIEDVVFMFFGGGIAAGLYELSFRKKIKEKFDRRLKKHHALWAGLLGAIIFHYLVPLNDMYLLITFNFFGALAILWQRKDLISHSIIGGLLALASYTCGFLVWVLIYPNLINDIYQLQLTSGVFLLGLPLEEFLYAFTFGMIWAPIYEYEHRYKDSKI
jgi:hypothetical protein